MNRKYLHTVSLNPKPNLNGQFLYFLQVNRPNQIIKQASKYGATVVKKHLNQQKSLYGL